MNEHHAQSKMNFKLAEQIENVDSKLIDDIKNALRQAGNETSIKK